VRKNFSSALRTAVGILAIWSTVGSADAHQDDRIFYPEPGHEQPYIVLQQWIAARYGGENENGLPEAINRGYILAPHLGAVVTGEGFGLTNPSAAAQLTRGGADLLGHAGRPPLLLYAPKGGPGPTPGGGTGSFADIWLDPPYRLIGWVYWGDYDPANRPHLDGIPDEAWAVHEAGWHMSDGTMILTPPQEDCPGQMAQEAPTGPVPWYVNDDGVVVFGIFPHRRAWIIHFWRNPEQNHVPFISLAEPFHQLPSGTLNEPPGTFFYPACPSP